MSLEDIPSAFADAVGINETSAGIILSITVIFALLLPTLYLGRNSKGLPMISILVFFLAEAVVVGLGWLNAWVMVATVVLMAMGIALLGTKLVTGE